MSTIIVWHLLCTFFMTGIIWFVQIVHYPMILEIPEKARTLYCQKNPKLTACVVIPPMVVELFTGLLLFIDRPSAYPWNVGLLLLIAIWSCTLLIQMPLHRQLGMSGSQKEAATLVRTNWIRTALWSARAVLCYIFLLEKFSLHIPLV